MPNLNTTIIRSIPLTLPPLDEQRRIAAILDKADALRRKRKRAVEMIEEMAHSLFDSIHQESRSAWQELVFADLTLKGPGNFGNGPFGSDLLTSELRDEGVLVIYIRDIVTERYERISQSFVTSEKAAKLSASSVKGDDLLITKVGDPPGVAAVYPLGQPDGIVTQDVIRLRLDPMIAIPEYLAFFLNSGLGKHAISGITVAATRARFSLTDLKQLRVLLPPVKVQRRFKHLVESISATKRAGESSSERLSNLFSSLQHRAFSGQL